MVRLGNEKGEDQRYYTAIAGRFQTPDPSRGVDPHNPITWNRYIYSNDDPVNRYDPSGLDSCDPNATCVTVTATTDPVGLSGASSNIGSLWSYGAAWQAAQADLRVAAALFAAQSGSALRQEASGAIKNLSDDCKKALGQHWNLYNGNDSLLYKIDSNNPNAPSFVNVNSSFSSASWTTMGHWDPSLTGLQSLVPTVTYLATVAGSFYSSSTNSIVVGYIFSNMSQADQNVALLHETLHAYTGFDDIKLASALNLGTFGNATAASLAITNYLQSDCMK